MPSDFGTDCIECMAGKISKAAGKGNHWYCTNNKCKLARKPNTGNRKFKKVKDDGYLFDSQGEHGRYLELKQQQACGEIRGLQVHTLHRLQLNGRPLLVRSKRYPNGRPKAGSTWTDDFSYEERRPRRDGTHEWVKVVEDFKGRDTYEERFKRGVFELLTGIQIRVTY